jgi:hypothetical protein
MLVLDFLAIARPPSAVLPALTARLDVRASLSRVVRLGRRQENPSRDIVLDDLRSKLRPAIARAGALGHLEF